MLVRVSDECSLGGVVRIHRADLQRIMVKHALTHGRLHLSRKLVSYTEHADSVHLEFMDGSKGTGSCRSQESGQGRVGLPACLDPVQDYRRLR